MTKKTKKKVKKKTKTAAKKAAKKTAKKPAKKTPRKSKSAPSSQVDLFADTDAGTGSPKPKKKTSRTASKAGSAVRKRSGSKRTKADADTMAKKQREISVSEFFSKNRHLLGFDNPAKALMTTIKEAVDNSLDACEEAGILPDLRVEVTQLAEDRFVVSVQDNGPGIVKSQVPKIFGKLLYGSKFHRLRQSRGQQGIGISAAGMYGQLTTGKPVRINSKPGKRKPAHYFEVRIDTRKNAPVVTKDMEVPWDGVDHGTKVEIELEATYRKGARSVDAYLEQTALANPHVQLEWRAPKDEPRLLPRTADDLPVEPQEIKPHPLGVELGVLMKMLHDTRARNIKSFMTSEFSRVSSKVAEDILSSAKLKPSMRPSTVARNDAEALFRAIGGAKLMAPPTNCLSPIGEELLLDSLKSLVTADFHTSVTRSPAVYRGNPFQVEAALAYGGPDLNGDDAAQVFRFANRVPLLYQQGACAVSKAVIDTGWRNYLVQQSRGALPVAPMLLVVHIASVWVPFTSESKEAIAHYPEILKEIRLAVQDCGRKLATHIRRGRREAEANRKQSYIQKYIPHIGIALREILELSETQEKRVVTTLKDTLERSRKM